MQCMFQKIPDVPYDSKYLRCVSCNMKQATKYLNSSIFATMNIKTDTKVEKVMVFSNTLNQVLLVKDKLDIIDNLDHLEEFFLEKKKNSGTNVKQHCKRHKSITCY